MKLLHFLRNNSCEELYLVGDIIDEWVLKRGSGFSAEHLLILLELLKLSKNTKVFYIVGNHDDFLRNHLPLAYLENINIIDRASFRTMDNKNYLIIHGDQFDQTVIHQRWLAVLGDISYNFILSINHYLQFLRNFLGYKRYWSLSKYLKDRVKKVFNKKNNYDDIVYNYIKKNNYDGIICGHIHKPERRNIYDIDYLNCGDWIENCSAIIETHEGDLKILKNY
jgi:UDP-2,3-diacylglucosamine pyrophosphatase LpxH